jgi:glycerophosphoryl diester phosphodiesterase
LNTFKIIFIPALIMLSVFINDSVLPASRPPIPTRRPNLDILKIAHRGSTHMAPENTLPAYEKAIELGYDYAEVDVNYTKDGVPVLMHDDKVDRTTDGKGPVSDFTLEEIKKLDAGSWFGKEAKFKGTRVPTLEEALQTMQGRIKIYIDQKFPPRPVVLELLKKYGFYPDRVLIVGANEWQLDFLKFAPDAPVLPNVNGPDDIPKILETFPSAIGINAESNVVSKELVDKAHENGLRVFSNTLMWADQPVEMQRMLDAGVDSIQTDNPPTLLKVMEKMKKTK